MSEGNENMQKVAECSDEEEEYECPEDYYEEEWEFNCPKYCDFENIPKIDDRWFGKKE
jgi:hypothetical protein